MSAASSSSASCDHALDLGQRLARAAWGRTAAPDRFGRGAMPAATRSRSMEVDAPADTSSTRATPASRASRANASTSAPCSSVPHESHEGEPQHDGAHGGLIARWIAASGRMASARASAQREPVHHATEQRDGRAPAAHEPFAQHEPRAVTQRARDPHVASVAPRRGHRPRARSTRVMNASAWRATGRRRALAARPWPPRSGGPSRLRWPVAVAGRAWTAPP